jgi:hypothetical protein
VVSYGGVDRYYPSCNFELRQVSEFPQQILPGSFEITKVRRRDEEIVRGTRLLLASRAGYPLRAGSELLLADAGVDAGGPSMIMHTVRMNLFSAKQPGVFMLTCRGALDDPPRAEYISIDEMRLALGDKARMLLPGEE